jgi:hypothetical protein
MTGPAPTGPLPELAELRSLIDEGRPWLDTRTLCEIQVAGERLPVLAMTLGSAAPDAPAVGLFGGVHGLERIGASVVMAVLRSLIMRLRWDEVLHRQLESLRLVFMPLVNPGGAWLGTRANPAGVDLMRNAPIEAIEPVPYLLGGHRLSARLPWYRGPAQAPMEAESHALCALVQSELLGRRFSIAIDCHSGFGMRDRVWFPYAHTARPIRHLAEVHALIDVFENSYAHHPYVFEPQAQQYLTHGDLWDYLYLRADTDAEHVFLPLTLEMGSWLWIKKNPRQIFSRQGIFNPLILHRTQRVMRRHLSLMDYFMRAASSHERWLPRGALREDHARRARQRWYGEA